MGVLLLHNSRAQSVRFWLSFNSTESWSGMQKKTNKLPKELWSNDTKRRGKTLSYNLVKSNIHVYNIYKFDSLCLSLIGVWIIEGDWSFMRLTFFPCKFFSIISPFRLLFFSSMLPAILTTWLKDLLFSLDTTLIKATFYWMLWISVIYRRIFHKTYHWGENDRFQRLLKKMTFP